MRSITLTAMAAVIILSTTSIRAQHHTVRFFTSSGSPIRVNTLAFSPDGTLLAVSTKNGKTSLVRTSDGDIQYQHDLAPFSMTFTADGSHLFMLAPRNTQLLDVTNHRVSHIVLKVPKGYLGFALEIRSGKLLVKSITSGGPAAESGDIKVDDELVAVTSNGTRRSLLGQSIENSLAALAGPPGTPITLHVVRPGELAESKVTLRRQPANQVDGRFEFEASKEAATAPHVCVAFVEGKSFVLFDAANGNALSSLMPVDVRSAGQYTVSPDGRFFGLVAEGRKSSREMAVEIFDVAKQERILHAPLPERNFFDAAFTPDGKSFLIGSRDRIQILPLDSGRFAKHLSLSVRPPTAEASIKTNTPSRGSTASAAKAAAAKEVGPFPDSWTGANRRLLSCFAVSPAGVVAIGSPTGSVELWSLNKGIQIDTVLESATGREQAHVERIEFSPSGKWLSFYVRGTLHVVKTPAIVGD